MTVAIKAGEAGAARADYAAFLLAKQAAIQPCGRDVGIDDIHPSLFDFQKQVTRWAVAKGRCAVWLDTGLGKTRCQIEWARLLNERTLILAPLSVARQTVREGQKIGADVRYVRGQSDVTGDNKLWITNYEMLDAFDFDKFGAVVLDESSILKSLTGVTRRKLTEACAGIRYRLCCSATPAPNDYIELGSHAHFLGICTTAEMLSMFFINANKQVAIEMAGRIYEKKGSNKGGQEWRLKHHAEARFFQWLSTWAITMTKPSDLGYSDEGFVLPPLTVNPIFVRNNEVKSKGELFFTGLKGLGQRADVRRQGLAARLDACVRLVTTSLERGDSPCLLPTANIDIITISPTERNCDNKQKSGQKNELLNKSSEIESISITTICETEINTHEPLSKTKSETDIGESGTPTVPSTEKRNLSSINNETEQNDARNGCHVTDSPEMIMMPSFRDKAEGAQFVEQQPLVNEIDGALSTLTMTMYRAQYEAYSAQAATSVLGNSEITPNCSAKQLITSKKLPKWVIWCGLDSEQDLVAKTFGPLCVSISGSMPIEEKIRLEELWREGPVPIMVTKSKIFGFGVNWQCASNMAFMGLSDSWESFYQCIRREWRYGQTSPVNVHIILSEAEDAIHHNVMRKDALATRLRQKLVAAMKDYERMELGMLTPIEQEYREDEASGDGWRLLLGDSCKRLAELETDSIALSVYSPPFADLFTYSASDRDLGNCKDWDEFFQHYAYVIREILRVTKPGRMTCVHTSDIPAMDSRDGWIGVKDFPGEVIRTYQKEGWIFKGRAFIPKNPQAQAIRTHSQALLFIQLNKDSLASRPALIDQILLFKKAGDAGMAVTPVANGEMDNETWIEWANGVWTGISESDTLNVQEARGPNEEKHICPLQKGTIERCIKLYSNPGELVLSPFAGIGSEGWVALRFGRRFVGIELKPEYFNVAAKNLAGAARTASMPDLFSWADQQSAAAS